MSDGNGSTDSQDNAFIEERGLDVDADANTTTTTESPATTTPAPTAIDAPQQEAHEATTKSSTESSTGPEVYILLSVGGAAMVAGAAIFVLRRKKMAIDALEEKTPRPTTTVASHSFILSTQRDASVL